ncbi:MAG: 2-C-methyl-D-erythritol 4-phosphate cytidylyltransferase [Firmicutes bacterium]|nr:2-C-methyl-D-erythritol 4-phosphate cytidylyltransferase [Bacillota bacterium]
MVIGILLAAGESLRLKSRVTPKQFLKLGKKKLYQFSLDTFVKHKKVDQIVLVVNDQFITQVQDEIKSYAKLKMIHVIAGGKTRQESSYLALQYAKFHIKPDFVLIHDVARPMISELLIDTLIAKLKHYPAMTLARQINDSLFVVDDKATLNNYLGKNDIYLSQTPQAFEFETILDAHEYARKLKIKSAIDDASLLFLMGKKVHVVTGSRLNFKVVSEDDLLLFEKLI